MKPTDFTIQKCAKLAASQTHPTKMPTTALGTGKRRKKNNEGTQNEEERYMLEFN